jgi:pre-rRNA-processing protein IPI3
MLTEHLLTATSSSLLSSKPSSSVLSSASKDATLALHALNPSPSIITSFKKSSAPPKCVAVTSTHIFAAQEGKAVVNVYSREKSNLECTVAFNERISCLIVVGDKTGAGVLVLGTEGGRIILWEVRILNLF